ncbi:Fum1p [Penicillium angulare]|uniref:Fum1p n=1 Tax=Penicillium angulare TaxID=116970 RepID=UPI00253FB7E2|nr:Fum1p [Penicillium angulare]KAJ5291615.1 Fum1p [Penicillium angulare]
MSSQVRLPNRGDALHQIVEEARGKEPFKHNKLCKDHVSTEAADATPEQSHCSPIAIVGMALRLPGGVTSPDEFWDFLIEKKDGLCEVPGNRYNVDSFYSDSRPHSVKTKKGYFLQHDPANFDAEFFSIKPYEAARMDPQQRQLLEVVWECLESAGETNWRGKDIGCFVGVYGEDWLELASKDFENTDRYHVLGTGQFALSNRVSYEYDFQGPSMTLQTGCSSSLVGLHEACQALYSRECSSAIVAGTNLIFAPTMTTTMSDNMVLSPSGVCRTFDEKADGYGRGEAINAVYIKRLSDAVRDGDHVRAIIRATSTNCDGRTPSITTPGSLTQERLIKKTYAKAGIENITETGFFECHGTGTTIGDTAEVSVVAKLFQNNGTVIGSVKPNVGHSEGASGITSLIKAVISLEHSLIPPNIYFDTPSPSIPFKEANLQVPTSVMHWPTNRKERMSVNCFGIGGSNAHAVLESTTEYFGKTLREKNNLPCDSSRLLVVSAKDSESLQQRILGVSRYANENSNLLQDLAYTLGVRRDHMKSRAFGVAHANKPIDAASFQTGKATPMALTFVFTGQGAQWPGMGKDLMENFESFQGDIQRLDGVMQELEDPPGWSLKDELVREGSESCVNNSEYSQPLCTALQIGLVNLLRRMGLEPSSVVGHSSGEIAAAYAAGAITAKSAIAIAYYRGKIAKTQEGRGAMVAIGMGRADISPYLQAGIVLACENSPDSVTLSGDAEAIRMITKKIKSDFPDVACRMLKVKIAYHSHHMLDAGLEYEPKISAYVKSSESMLPLFSTVTSRIITNPQDLDAAYWRRNLESPVLFADAVRGILDISEIANQFLEIGPHSTLAGPLRQIFKSVRPKIDPAYIPTLTRYADDSRSQLLHTLGCVFANGGNINFPEANGNGILLTDLPSYPWQHKVRHWHESRLATQWRYQNSPHHEILGVRVAESSDLEPAWRNLLRLEDVPWIWDHVLQSNIVFPAAGYVAMAGEAIRQLNPEVEDYSVKNLALKSPLLLKDEVVSEIITQLRPISYNDSVDSEWYAFSIIAYDGTGWTKHCQGQVRSRYDHAPSVKEIKRNIRPVDSNQWYRALDKQGLSYGARFRGLKDIFVDPVKPRADATTTSNSDLCSSRYTLHPTVIDQCLQLLSVALTNGIARRIDSLAIPAAIGHLYVRGQASEMKLDASLAKNNIGNLLGNANLISDGLQLLSLRNAAFFSVQDHSLNQSRIPLTAEIRWSPAIDLMPPNSWLSPPKPPGREYEAWKDFGRLGYLYLLETADKLADITPTETHMTRYKAWINAEASKLRSGHELLYPEIKDWVKMSSGDRQCIIKDLVSRYKDNEVYWSVAECTGEVYKSCVDFATGTRVPLDALMEEDKLAKYYEVPAHVDSWHHTFQLLGHANPGMRVLEIGAGTGSGTMKALKGLKSSQGDCLYAKYVFTDLSPGFTMAAQDKFVGHQSLEFKVLDISRDPEEQGFEPHSFDLVFASNVLHATPHLETTLRHVHKLMSPNGKLMLHELHPYTRTTDFIMIKGVLPGWWIGENDDRADRPYVSPERWDYELRATGFTGSESYAYDHEPPFQHTFTMISRILPQDPWACQVASSFRERSYSVEWGTLEGKPPADQDIIFLMDIQEPFMYEMHQEKFLRLQAYMSEVKQRIIWVTKSCQLSCEDPRYGLVFGFARTLRHEMGLDISIFESDIFDTTAARSLCQVHDIIEVSREIGNPNLEYEFSCQRGSVHIGRCYWDSLADNEAPSVEVTEKSLARLSLETYALLDTLHWVETAEKELRDDQVEVEIKYIGLNFRDIMISMGLVGDKDELGFEGSGVVRRIGADVLDGLSIGDHVALISPGLFQSRVIVSPQQCFKAPTGISLDEVATMPTVYATAMYSLIELGSIKKGQTVLIHSACGGVGLASIQICQHIGAEIFATVGNEDKVQYLMDQFGIRRNRIFNSRSSAFLPDIMRETKGRGVDLVLNSLAGELLHASWECVAARGKMIELGKRDFLTNGTLSMVPFAGNRSFHGVDLLKLGEECPQFVMDLVAKSGSWYEQGHVKPIQPVKKFQAKEVLDAFRYMQQGVHMGKILIEMPQTFADVLVSRSELDLSFSSQASYLLVGGLGGLGRAISTWMVENGARYLIYLSRSAGHSKQDRDFMQELEIQGCHVTCVRGDVTKLPDVKSAVAKCIKPLAGVLQMSMALNDRTFANMTYDEWTSSLSSKVTGTWNLHHAVEGQNLDFFVLFSSLCGIFGNTGQANYSSANTFLDSFANYRRQLGLPCSAVALGPVEDIGLVSRDPKVLQTIRAGSAYIMSEGEVMKGLQVAIAQCKSKDLVSSPVLVGTGITKHSSDATVRIPWARDIRYALYCNIESIGDTHAQVTNDHLKALLAKVEQNPAILDEPETEITIQRELGRLITQHMNNMEDMDDVKTAQIAIDSLMSIEIRGWARRNLGLEISLAEISKAGTVGALATVTINHLRAKYGEN